METPLKTKVRIFLERFFPKGLALEFKKYYYGRLLVHHAWASEPDLEIVRLLVSKGACAVDVGANIGIYSRYLSDFVGSVGKVFSIEPIPETSQILDASIRKLHLGNVRIFTNAVSDRDGTIEMTLPCSRSAGSNIYGAHIVGRDSVPSDGLIFTVLARSLDSLLTQENRVDFIKCDVEGYEFSVVTGAEQTNRKFGPAWLIEICSNPDLPSSDASRIIARLRERGYEPYIYDGQKLRKRKCGEKCLNYFFLQEKHLSLVDGVLERS